jgi:hypothetical protein
MVSSIENNCEEPVPWLLQQLPLAIDRLHQDARAVVHTVVIGR